MCTELNFLF